MTRCFLIIVMLTGFALTVYAQADPQAQTEEKETKKRFLYQWTDKKGIVHIADGLDKVPKGYRNQAVKIKQPDKEEADQGPQVQQPSGYPSGAASEAADAAAKAAWQRRMRAAKQRLANAQKRHQELDQRRSELLQRWGGAASGRLADRVEADRVEQEMKGVQKEIDEAQNDIDMVIPEEARKAGIPPGWLRE